MRRNEFQAAIAAEEQNLATLARAGGRLRTHRLRRPRTRRQPLPARPPRPAHVGPRRLLLHLQRGPDPPPETYCRFVDSAGSAAFDLLLQARQAGGTWLLGFLLPRYAAEAITVLDEARRRGFKIALVTDSRLAPWAEHADVVFPAPVGSRLVFDSHAAPMVLAGLLVQAIADAEPARTQLRLEEHEALNENHGYYLH